MKTTKSILKGYWNQISKGYSSRIGYNLTDIQRKLWLDILSEIVGENKKLKILDVGTGPGFLAFLFCELGNECTGIDFSEKMIEYALKNSINNGFKCNFQCADAENLPFEDESFDVVANRHLLWTLMHPGKAVREWVRVLKPGGKLIIMDGEWEEDNLDTFRMLKKICGKHIISLTKRKFSSNSIREFKEVKKSLPFRGVNAGKIAALMEAAGIDHITVPNIDKLIYEDVSNRTLGYRLIYNDKRYIVVGEK